MENILKNLNPICQKAFQEAFDTCHQKGNYTFEIEHLLLRLINIPYSDAQFILRYYELDIPSITQQLEATVGKMRTGSDSKPAISPHIQKALEKAWVTASLKLRHTSIRSGVILLSLLDSDSFRGILLESCPLILRLSRVLLKNDLDHLLALSSERKYHFENGAEFIKEGDKPKDPLKVLTESIKIKEVPHSNYILDLSQKTSKALEVLGRTYCNNVLVVAPTKKDRKTLIDGIIHKSQGILNIRKVVAPWDTTLPILASSVPVKKSTLWIEEDKDHPLAHFVKELEFLFETPTYQVILSCDPSSFEHLQKVFPEIHLHCQPIIQLESSFADTCAILRIESLLLAKRYEMTIDEAVFEGVALLAERFIQGIPMPHKAVQLLDNTCSWVKRQEQTKTEVTLEDVKAYCHYHTGVEPSVIHPALEGFKVTFLEDLFQDSHVQQEKAYKLLAQKLCGKPTGNRFFFCGPYGFGQTQISRSLAYALTGFSDQVAHLSLHLTTPTEFRGKLESLLKKMNPYGVISFSNLELAGRKTLNELSDWLDSLEGGLHQKATLIFQSEANRKPLVDLWQRQAPTVQELFHSEPTSLIEDKGFWHDYSNLSLQHLEKFLPERHVKTLTPIPFLPYSLSQYTDIIRFNLRTQPTLTERSDLPEKDVQHIASFCRNQDIEFGKIPDIITQQAQELIKEGRPSAG